ncbi:Arabinogalactan peptide 23 [Quillaja saponaria]|uniref:Arabinogalactan peptide 23 n=1 Tax=Quillaja saponaria TaxID=32244 RepID=A0AAD7P9L4_QUISA|nr:Arabinogalactan peptide 23 [Quillaja saponaria]
MDMKKISCAVLVIAASMTASMASAEAPAPSFAGAPESATSASAMALPMVGSLVGASLLSFFTLYLH